jgi:predicted O-linked N-acetylglucosamine transferase (SPINDLY family)
VNADVSAAMQRAVALHQRGDLPHAITLYEAVVATAPDHAVAWHNLGTALRAVGDDQRAMTAYRRCLQADDAHAGALWQLGRLLLDHGDTAAALTAFGRLVTQDAGFHEPYARMARDWFAARRYAEAETAFRQLSAARPAAAEPHFRLGTALLAQDRLDEADAQFAETARLERRPGLAMVQALLLPAIPPSEPAIDQVRERMATRLAALEASGWHVDDPWIAVDTTPFHLAYHGRDDRPLMAQLARVYRSACPALATEAPHCRTPRRPERRLKVGFVSRFFGSHVVSAFWLDLVARLPQDRIDAVAIQVDDPGTPPPAVAAGIRLVPLRAPSLAGLRQRLADGAFDVLVYTDIGMEPITYFLAHARLAPVQIALGGHPVTTGLPSIDYFLSTDDCESADAAAHYTERLLRLPLPPVWIRRPAMPGPAGERPADERWYLCPQSLFKLQPAMDAAFAAILRHDPRGRLVLIDGSDEGQIRRWRSRFNQAHGDVGDRVQVRGRLPFAAYGKLLLAADALLDPFPFNGGHSTYTACALGVPPVTLPGPYLRSRVTAGVLNRLGVTDTIAADVAGYVDLAVSLAQDGERRRAIGARLQREAGALFETDAAVMMLADLFEAAVDAAVSGERLTEAGMAGRGR